MLPLTQDQIETWQAHHAERLNDKAEIEVHGPRDARRRVVRDEMLTLLDDFLAGRCDLQTFKETFDKKTRTEWDVFGLKAMSGAMFLNTLVKHIPDQDDTATHLREVLRLPGSVEQGQAHLSRFIDFLNELVDEGAITRKQVQSVRAPFFVSGWWHLQSMDEWPIYYISGRKALSSDDLYSDTGDPVADYFAFREVFLALQSELDLPAWELEHLLAWYEDKPGPIVPPETTPAVIAPTTEDDEDDAEQASPSESSAHTYVQWQLATLGKALNCEVWVASNDHSRTHDGQRLGDLSEAALPNMGMDAETRRIVGLIDMIWLQGKKVVAAFEIESTTSIFSGILRMSDLVAVAPNISFPLYLVVPENRVAAVQKQLCRETFQALELPDRCRYFTFESLEKNYEYIAAWAGSPEAVRKLSHKVDCGS